MGELMKGWAFFLFCFGVCALLLYVFDIFSWFTRWWGVILMFIAFGMLTRIWQKEKEGNKEKLRERIKELEALLKF
jgi:uncharacterized membrane protein YqjE